MLHFNESFGQSPFIESVSPKSGYSGQIINIKGIGLAGFDRVFFGGVEGEIISVENQLMEVEVPTGATFENITVLNSSTGLYYSGEHFLLSFGGEQGIANTDFDPQIDIFSESGLYDVTLSDLDGDGKNEIIGANSTASVATVLRNLSTVGNISFAKTSLNIGTPSLNTTAGDLNGDGKPEVVFSEGGDGNRLIILVNSSTPGNLSFTLRYITVSDASTKRVVIKDIDLDGKPELIVSNQNGNNIFLLKNTSTGGNLSFSNDIIELTVENASSTAGLDVEDINGDGRPDIVTNQFLSDGGGFYVAANQSSPGNFSFDSFQQFNATGTFVNLKVADVNNDSKPDVVATLFLSSSVSVFLNESGANGGEIAFGSAQLLNTDLRPWGLDFGDMDGDGNIDIIVSTIGDDKTVNVLSNSGNGGLDFSKVSIPVTFINRNVKVGDVDGDSKPDIVFASVDDDNNNVTSSNISILRNNKCIVPEISPLGPINSCEGNPVVLKTQNIPGLIFEWRKDGSIVKSGSENFIEINSTSESGNYTVSIISEEGNCVEISESVEVTIGGAGSLASPDISTNSPVCNGGVLSLSVTDVGATKYEWRGPQGFVESGITVDVENFNFDKAGRYYLDVYLNDCIVETKSVVVDVISAPNFLIERTGSGMYCEGETVSLNVVPDDNNFTYQWFEGNSPISGATSANFNPTNSGEYFVEITDQLNTFCPSIYSDTVNITFLELPEVNFDLPSNACIESSVSFINESEIAAEATPQYQWNFGDGNTSTQENPNHAYSEAGVYDVVLQISYNGFPTCISQVQKQITVSEAPSISINSSASSICEGDSVTLSVSDNFQSYEWNTGDEGSIITVNAGGEYSVTVTDANGCEGFSEISIQQFPSPEVNLFASATSVNAGEEISIEATGLLNYTWFADSTQLEFTEDQINYSPSNTTTIRVEGQDENGCFGSAEIVLNVEETNIGDRLIPMKFFSPNGDGIAEFWMIENIEGFTQCAVEIYDKQGNKIYEAKPYNNDWQGRINGSPVPDGVYYFIVRCDGSGIEKSGSITLLR